VRFKGGLGPVANVCRGPKNYSYATGFCLSVCPPVSTPSTTSILYACGSPKIKSLRHSSRSKVNAKTCAIYEYPLPRPISRPNRID